VKLDRLIQHILLDFTLGTNCQGTHRRKQLDVLQVDIQLLVKDIRK